MNQTKRILTIQDISCVGQCSLTVALPVISACGVEAAVLPSSVLSTHTGGFSGYTFRDLTDDMPAIEAHWIREDIRFDAFYTGYVSPSQIDIILHIMDSCAKPGALRFVDPVMADHGKLYAGFDADFPDQMAKLCRNADYILPNITEAAMLLHKEIRLTDYDEAYIEELLRGLHTMGAKNVVLTGVSFEEDQLGAAIYDGSKVTYVFNTKIPRFFHGTGDVFSSAFVGAMMRGFSASDAAQIAADLVCNSLLATEESHWYGVQFEAALPAMITRLGALSEKN